MSERLIAVGLYGEARVEEEWRRNGWMRARVRYRLKKSLELMNGGYCEMAAGA